MGSARTEFSDASTDSVSRSRSASGLGPLTDESNNECGVCRPNTVIVCAPASRNSADRMLASVSEWQ